MALRLCCGGSGAFLCGQNRLAGPRLRPIRPSRLAPMSWWAVGGMVPAAATRAAGCCSAVHVDHASDEKGGGRVIENAVTLCPRRRPCGEVLLSEGDGAGGKRGGGRAPAGSWEKMDKWMHECIVEIVRNIGEAPFLVYVFCNNNDARSGGGAALKLETEAADPEKWRAIRSRWAATPPDGVILVEELQRDDGGGITRAQETLTSTSTTTSTWGHEGGEQDGEQDDDDDDGEDWPTSSSSYLQGGGGGSSSSSSNSKTWGILVQGWGGVDCAACYILNTCRVPSAFGFCTHFCLTRARCFEDTADVQLKRLWLVNNSDKRTVAPDPKHDTHDY